MVLRFLLLRDRLEDSLFQVRRLLPHLMRLMRLALVRIVELALVRTAERRRRHWRLMWWSILWSSRRQNWHPSYHPPLRCEQQVHANFLLRT